MFKQGVLAASIMAAMAVGSAGAVTVEELQAQIKTQQAQLEALAAAVEKQQAGTAGGEWFKNTTIGGYGELHFNHVDGAADQIDFHRFVLFFGHRFNEKVRFFSEFELEHSFVKDTQTGAKAPGEVELEQAFIEWNYAGAQKLVVGQFLVPVGIMNETHEPPTFYGVERNNVEKNIIPATWWEGGVMLQGELVEGVKYDLAVHSGLKNKDANVRSGRQKVAEATAEDHAYTARLRYTGVPGLEVGVAYQRQQDLTQGDAACASDKDCGQADLWEGHVAYQAGGFGLRALYAQWDIDGNTFTTKGANDQYGWYVEPSYKITPKVGVFARYSEWDNASGRDGKETRYEQFDAGVNYWLTDRAVFKFDIQNESNPTSGSKDKEGFNLGLGYSF